MGKDIIRIEGLKELLGKVHDLKELRPVTGVILEVGLHLMGALNTRPPVKRLMRISVYGSAFKSDKQRRFFFYALGKKKIGVPYYRGSSPGSQTFGKRWAIAREMGGLRVVIGNNTSYGPFLMDKERQSKYHAMVGWRTTDDVVAEETADIVEVVQAAIQRAWEK